MFFSMRLLCQNCNQEIGIPPTMTPFHSVNGRCGITYKYQCQNCGTKFDGEDSAEREFCFYCTKEMKMITRQQGDEDAN